MSFAIQAHELHDDALSIVTELATLPDASTWSGGAAQVARSQCDTLMSVCQHLVSTLENCIKTGHALDLAYGG